MLWVTENYGCNKKHIGVGRDSLWCSASSKLRGNQNTIWGNQNTIWGTQNAIWGNQNAIWGNQNAIWGNQNAIWGNQNAFWSAVCVRRRGCYFVGWVRCAWRCCWRWKAWNGRSRVKSNRIPKVTKTSPVRRSQVRLWCHYFKIWPRFRIPPLLFLLLNWMCIQKLWKRQIFISLMRGKNRA